MPVSVNCLVLFLLWMFLTHPVFTAGSTNADSESDGTMNASDLAAQSNITIHIENAERECFLKVLSKPYPNDGKVYCNATFDGWGCWNYTLAGTRALIYCPDMIYGFDPALTAFKDCMEDGTWFRHPITNRSWSNYTTCVNLEDYQQNKANVNIFIAGYSCSLAFVSIALFIFIYFKQLQCARVTVHKHLFTSYVLTNTAWIIWYTRVVTNADVLSENYIWCQVFHVINQYLLACNYLWMFCEGLYLHTMIVVTFVSEEKLMLLVYAIGWGFPQLLAVTYGLVRGLAKDGMTDYCWINEVGYQWVIGAPCVISVIANLFFLCNIMRVLVLKLRAVNAPDPHQTWKAVRAVLILIPLLGIHYLLLGFRPPKGQQGQDIYLIISAVFSSFQGMFVALIFCFFNGEVIRTIYTHIMRDLLRNTDKISARYNNQTVIEELPRGRKSLQMQLPDSETRPIHKDSAL